MSGKQPAGLESVSANPFLSRKDNSSFGCNNSINSALSGDFRQTSTSTKLWESAGGRQKAYLHQGDPGLSDQMLRLGTEPAERLRRTHSLSFSDNGRRAYYVNQSDGASDISSNSATLKNDRHAVLTGAESSTAGGRTFNTGRVAGSATSSTVTVIRRPTREGIMNNEDVSPLSRETAYPMARVHERYRGTSYTLDSGFIGPRGLCMDVGGEGIGSRSSGLSIRNNNGIEAVTSRSQLPNRGTYQAADGNYSTSRTDQDRRPSAGSQFQVPSRRVHSGPQPPRSSSQSFPVVPHHPGRGRGPSSGSSYTYGLGDQRTSRERTWSAGNTGSAGRHTAPRSHQSSRQKSSSSISDGTVRPRMTENYRSPGNQECRPGGTEDHARQGQQFRDGASVRDKGANLSDQKYQRPQSRTESFHSRCGIEEPQEQDEGLPEDIEQLAHRARELLNIARTNRALPVSAPEGPVDFDVVAQDTSERLLDSIARMIEHPSLPGAVDSEELPKAANIAKAPVVNTAGSLHWPIGEFPEGNSPQSQIDVGDTVALHGVKEQTNQNYLNRYLDSDDLPESNPPGYYEAHEGLGNWPELDLSLVGAHEGRLLEKRDIPSGWLPTSTSQAGESLDSIRPRLMENDNPHVPASRLPELSPKK